jgi:SAM-dependent methyltransferase
VIARATSTLTHLSPAIQLAIISLLCLYFEMVIIRWLASDIRVFAYFKNLPLLAAFLGLGLGCLRIQQRSIRWASVFLLAISAAIAFAGPLGLTHLHIPQLGDTKLWNDGAIRELDLPVVLAVNFHSLKFLIVVFGLFFLVVEFFAILGGRLGALFDALPPTKAYGINLAASLAGIWLFALLSWLMWPPLGWLALGCIGLVPFLWHVGRRRLFSIALLAVVVLLVALAPSATRWSPYYRVDLSPYKVPAADGGQEFAGWWLSVNHDVLQYAFNLSNGFVQTHPSELLEIQQFYNLPYRFAQPRRVLIVGAGMGNDVAAALRYGAEHVDAVEIDPAIVALGREYHPERPYLSPKVNVITDDARSFFSTAREPYDLIVFGWLDSHTLLSSMSSVRLDSYVYTIESLAQARALLKPGGHLAMGFSTATDDTHWLRRRLFQMVTTVFGEEPLALGLNFDISTMYAIGPSIHERAAGTADLAPLVLDPSSLREPLPPATDDWPFLYLRDRAVPLLPYGGVLAILLLLSTLLVRRASRGTELRLEPPMVLLGAAFMLLETKSISQLSLLFGSTWLVNAFIISSILVLALIANLYVARQHPSQLGPFYVLILLALAADYLVPLGVLGGFNPLAKGILGSVLPVLPILFAGIIFSTVLSRSESSRAAFGSNLLGALAGGLLEYISMATGFKALGLIALLLYAGSWLAMRHLPAAIRPTRPVFQKAEV